MVVFIKLHALCILGFHEQTNDRPTIPAVGQIWAPIQFLQKQTLKHIIQCKIIIVAVNRKRALLLWCILSIKNVHFVTVSYVKSLIRLKYKPVGFRKIHYQCTRFTSIIK